MRSTPRRLQNEYINIYKCSYADKQHSSQSKTHTSDSSFTTHAGDVALHHHSALLSWHIKGQLRDPNKIKGKVWAFHGESFGNVALVVFQTNSWFCNQPVRNSHFVGLSCSQHLPSKTTAVSWFSMASCTARNATQLPTWTSPLWGRGFLIPLHTVKIMPSSSWGCTESHGREKRMMCPDLQHAGNINMQLAGQLRKIGREK